MQILILTDNKSHSESNSVYDLGAALVRHQDVDSVWIANRNNPDNYPFFYHLQPVKLRAHRLDPDFSFQKGQKLFNQKGRWKNLSDFDLVWLRLPRPIPFGFFDFLESAFPDTLFLNRPSGIQISSSKAFLLRVPEICPPISLCRNEAEVLAFGKKTPIVLKPVEDYGGRGILRIEKGHCLRNGEWIPIIEVREEMNRQFAIGGYLGMEFLKFVDQGDKRIVVVNGAVIGAVLRMPPPGSWICNAAQGGQAVQAEADEIEVAMAKRLYEELAPLGIAMFGMDTLVGNDGNRVLSEVNTLSIGGIQALGALSGIPAADRVVHQFLAFAKTQKAWKN